MLFLILALPVGLLLLCGLALWVASLKYSHLPNVLGSPVFGNLSQVYQSFRRVNPDELLEWITQQMKAKSTDTIVLWNGPLPVVLTADPQIVENLFNNHAAIDKEPFMYDVLAELTGGVFSIAISDSIWRHHRRSMLYSFTPIMLKKYHDIFVAKSMELVQVLQKQKEEDVFDVSPFLVFSTGDIILATHHGIDLKILKSMDMELASDFRRVIQLFANAVLNPLEKILPAFLLPSKRTPKVDKFFKQCIEGLYEDNKKRKISGDDSDLPYAHGVLEQGLAEGQSLEQIDHQLREIFYEGSLLIARVTSFALLYLAIFPKIQKEVWEEQYRLLPDPGKTPTFEDIKKMTYLERVIMETVRKVSSPIIGRRLRKELQVGKTRIPKNCILIFFSLFLRTNETFLETPNGFNPDHFLPENVQRRSKSMPLFGIAPRNCPGGRYSIHQCAVLISSIIRNFQISTPLKFEDLKYKAGIFLDLDGDYSVSLKRRTVLKDF